MCKYLIVGDVDHIQDYVFGSSRLRAIRGASALLDRAAEKVKTPPPPLSCNDAHRWDVLRWRGGQIVAILKESSKEEADDVCASIEKIFRDESKGEATITTACEIYQNDFDKAIKAAFDKVKKEKDGRQCLGTDGEAFLTSSYDRRCNLLPSQSATYREELGEPDEAEFYYISRSAKARWEAVLKKMPFDKDFQDKFCCEHIDKASSYKPGKLPYKPEDLWKDETEGQYMAFVMADGNAFGQMLETINEQEVYQKFSDELYDLTLTAIAQAAKKAGIASFPKNRKRRNKKESIRLLPFIPIILAGDDLSVLVRAEHASDFTYHLCDRFWKLSGEKERYGSIRDAITKFCEKEPEAGKICFRGEGENGWRLTLSVGMVIAQRTFPISAFRRFAGELRASAKSKLRSDPKFVTEGGVIDFSIITTATVQSLADIRQHYMFDETPEKDNFKEWTLLTARPYTVEQFGILRELAKKLRLFPRSKRKFLYREFFNGGERAREAYEFIMARERTNEENIIQYLEKLGCRKAEEHNPFRIIERGLDTPLLDAIELAELERGEQL